jgi:hypothetical protein
MKALLKWGMVATMSLGTMAACSSSSKPAVTTKAPATSATTAAGGAAGGSGSAAIDAFCAQAADLGKQLKAIIANPSSGNLATVQAAATKLVTDSQALITANPSDAAKISACAAEANPG